ncbi:hypothetical protein [Pontibacter burrus]|uniref:Lipoprotein n=1 Tax=Pontibacter burrus TaxID=2704466 RepID=A0A6B3LPX5_9BACT|nr:hypothetical protein [Pontibacter burrus]NEM97903.1 hypothetical protein [Pontibacter burrus]
MKLKKLYLTLIVLLCFYASAFTAKQDAEPDYFVFGLLYGKCKSGECITVYKLENKSLFQYKEETAYYPPFNTFHNGDYIELSRDKYQQVSTVTAKIPQQLLQSQSGKIGTFTDVKQDKLYFEYSDNGVKKFWVINSNK